MKAFLFSAMAVLFAIGFMSCSKSDDIVPTVPTVTTSLVAVAINTADLSGEISNGSAVIDTRGFCWSTSENPTPNDGHAIVSGTTGTMTTKLTGLTANTVYYARAYAISNASVTYGKTVKFWTYAVVDNNNNGYHTVKVGSQTWLVENLKATNYLNGDPVNKVVADNRWLTLTTGAYCDYNNSSDTAKVYGHLYNWYAAVDSRKFIKGFHTASQAEWTQMYKYLGQLYSLTLPYLAGPHMMDKYGWSNPKPTGTIDNETGFSALPGGGFSPDDKGNLTFMCLHEDFTSWAADNLGASSVMVDIDQKNCFFEPIYVIAKYCGFGVRLVAD
jgi:Fibrobacter succinogenes major domain (Fib_succ_major).